MSDFGFENRCGCWLICIRLTAFSFLKELEANWKARTERGLPVVAHSEGRAPLHGRDVLRHVQELKHPEAIRFSLINMESWPPRIQLNAEADPGVTREAFTVHGNLKAGGFL